MSRFLGQLGVIRASCNIEEMLKMPNNTKEMLGHARHRWKDVERYQVANV
jgi:hypothetical protein